MGVTDIEERFVGLHRWAAHVHQSEGDIWRALGIMAAGGALRNAALLLRELRMPDAAAAFCAACKEAGFHSPFAPTDAGAHPNVFPQLLGVIFQLPIIFGIFSREI